MNLQTIVVLLIILSAVAYLGVLVGQKLKAFSVKNRSCGTNCGCGSKAEN